MTKSSSFHASSVALSLTVKDLPKSLKWYSEVLGFTKSRDFVRDGVVTGAAMMAGGAEISINQDDGKKGSDRALGQGFSIRLTTDQSIDDVAARVRAAGGTLDSEPADMPWGSRIFAITDPNGYRFIVASPRK